MIIKTFDNGWGSKLPAKQFEQQILDVVISTAINNSSKTVLINSTWYTDEFHQSTLEWLRNNEFDCIILVSMLDPAIPQIDWYKEFKTNVIPIGYYANGIGIDYWALLLNKYHMPADLDILLDNVDINTAYLCLNRKPHWHRKQLYRQLADSNLLDFGLVSLGGVRTLTPDVAHDNLAPNAQPGEYGIPNDLITLGHMDNWRRIFLNVVTETVYGINRYKFVSEKIYKPIIGCRPFLVYDSDGATKWLTDRGFETYCNDFKDISDLDLVNPTNIVPFLKTLCEQSPSYYQQKFLALKDKIVYNKERFSVYVQEQQEIINKGIPCQI